jgi:hypothetical protein
MLLVADLQSCFRADISMKDMCAKVNRDKDGTTQHRSIQEQPTPCAAFHDQIRLYIYL